MSSNREKVKKMFDYSMRLVVIYAFERARIKANHADDLAYFQQVDQIITERLKRFYLIATEGVIQDMAKAGDIQESDINKIIQECMDKFKQYYWNFYQFGLLPGENSFFKKFDLNSEMIRHHFKDINRYLKHEVKGGDIELSKRMRFIKSYNIFTLIFKNNFDQIFFKYHEIDQAFQNQTEDFFFLNEFVGLINLLPYYSPYYVPSITDLESYQTLTKNKKHFSARYTPSIKEQSYDTSYLDLNHKPIALIDSILQFIFQHTQHLVNWHYFRDNRNEELSDEQRLKLMRDREDKECKQLDQVAKILEAMFSALPNDQKILYSFAKKKNSTKSVMTSLMFHNFKSNYLESKQENIVDNVSSNAKSDDELAHELYVEFFKYLRSGFSQIGIQTTAFTDGKIDKFMLTRDHGKVVIVKGSSFRINYINHMKKFINSP